MRLWDPSKVSRTLDWLLADGSGGTSESNEALSNDRKVCKRELQWAHALLLRDETANGAIDLVDQETPAREGVRRGSERD